jgi:hypothetical protein
MLTQMASQSLTVYASNELTSINCFSAMRLRGGMNGDKTSVALIDSLLSKLNADVMQAWNYYARDKQPTNESSVKFFGKFPDTNNVKMPVPQGFRHSEAFALTQRNLQDLMDKDDVSDKMLIIPTKDQICRVKDEQASIHQEDKAVNKGRLRFRACLLTFPDCLCVHLIVGLSLSGNVKYKSTLGRQSCPLITP